MQLSNNPQVDLVKKLDNSSSQRGERLSASALKRPEVNLVLPKVSNRTSITHKEPEKLDSNGRFDLRSFGSYFLKGVYNNVSSICTYAYQNPIKTVAIVGAGIATCIALPVAATALTITGVAIGAIKAAKGLYSMLKADNGDEVEKAAESLGDGLSTIALFTMFRGGTPTKVAPSFKATQSNWVVTMTSKLLRILTSPPAKGAADMMDNIQNIEENPFSS